jgi:hypothetical protein
MAAGELVQMVWPSPGMEQNTTGFVPPFCLWHGLGLVAVCPAVDLSAMRQ